MADTIFALSSGPAPSGLAVIRVSGPASAAVFRALTGRGAPPPPRVATLCLFRNPVDGVALDQGIALWFPGPHSFTGEDVLEIQGHGGAATIAAILSALARIDGCRQADPGEFSRRAFANGRLDLNEVEALSDLIQAETEAQRRMALRLASGAGSERYKDWTDRLMRLLATLEAAVDFPEDDLPETMLDRNEIDIRRLVSEFSQDIDIGSLSDAVRHGVRIAIVGAPNVGKSTLLNHLSGREAALVSDIAGTTRDVVEVRLDLGGYLATVGDTAGLRDSVDSIERAGIDKAIRTAASADLILHLFDGAEAPTLPDVLAERRDDILCVRTKTDLGPVAPEELNNDEIAISCHVGRGIDRLLDRLRGACEERYGAALSAVAVRSRHRDALSRARDALERSLVSPEFAIAAEEVRLALGEIGRITGRVDVEAVLDIVFSEFCIGK
ncbi:MAG: tRNA uridine-5-carboxymethylaminomethyl(34) synthesis GTPase MnmE [Alphaproteobacteria bacterium]